MPDSLNPIDAAPRVATIPQVHYSGADDTVVPPEVAQRFVRAAGDECAQARTVPNIAHDGDWARQWPVLLRDVPACKPPPLATQSLPLLARFPEEHT